MGGKGCGRRPKPTAQKKLEGNAGKRKLNSAEPQPQPGAPKMPADLSPEAAVEWNAIVPELLKLNVLAVTDGKALAAYCWAFAGWTEAQKEIDSRGLVIEEPVVLNDKIVGYKVKRNPAVTIANDYAKLMKSFLIEFGLTPASRSRLRVEKGGEEDPLDAFMNPGRPNAPLPTATPRPSKVN